MYNKKTKNDNSKQDIVNNIIVILFWEGTVYPFWYNLYNRYLQPSFRVWIDRYDMSWIIYHPGRLLYPLFSPWRFNRFLKAPPPLVPHLARPGVSYERLWISLTMHDCWLFLLLPLAMAIITSALPQWLEHTHSPKTQRRSKVQYQPLGPRRTRWLDRFKWVFKLTGILNLTCNGHASNGKDGLWIDWDFIASFYLFEVSSGPTGVKAHVAQGFKSSIILMIIRSWKAEKGAHKRRVAFGWLLEWLGVPVAVCGPRTLVLVSSLAVLDRYIDLYIHLSLFLSFSITPYHLSVRDKRLSRWMDDGLDGGGCYHKVY